MGLECLGYNLSVLCLKKLTFTYVLSDPLYMRKACERKYCGQIPVCKIGMYFSIKLIIKVGIIFKNIIRGGILCGGFKVPCMLYYPSIKMLPLQKGASKTRRYNDHRIETGRFYLPPFAKHKNNPI